MNKKVSNNFIVGSHLLSIYEAFRDRDFEFIIGLSKSSDFMITFNNYSFCMIILLIVCLISHLISPSKAIDILPLRDRTKYQKLMIKLGVISIYFFTLNTVGWLAY